MAFFNPLSDAFGLDIGDRSFKVVQISKKNSAKQPYRLRAWGSVSVPEGVMERGEIINMTQAVKYVRELLSKTHGRLKGRAVAACLPEAKSFIKIVEAEKGATQKQLQDVINRELEQNIPLSTSEIYYDWQILDEQRPTAKKQAEKTTEKNPLDKEPAKPLPPEPAAAADETTAAPPTEETPENAEAAPPEEQDAPAKTKLLLAAAPKNLIDSYTQLLEASGLAPIAFEVEALAISRAAVPTQEEFDEPIGILDIGATRSSLVIYDEGILQMSIGIPLSGNELTKIISDKLSITPAEAEVIKVECGLDAHRCEDRMWNILLPLIDDMSSKIRNALRFYKIGFPMGKKIEKLYLCGGGAHFREIDTVLSRKLTIKVRRGDALANFGNVLRSFPPDGALTYTTAIGLAMRAADEQEQFRRTFRI
ncbi:MAG: pilus assembly protein PilM [Patescibacteria group bacterium]